ncbi:MAG: hypothetical protein R3C61_22700 [Bacteroidia bacterium]
MKKTAALLITFALLTSLLISCRNDEKNEENSGEETNLSSEASEPSFAAHEPEMTIFYVRVDKLRLRKEAGQTAETITAVPEGSFVTGTGEVSSFRDTIELRGMYYREPYYKVVTSDPEPQTGFMFGGGLQPVYAGPAAGSPDMAKITELSKFLLSLPPSELTSGAKAWEFVRKNFPKESPAVSDAAYILFSSFMRQMEVEGMFYSLVDQIEWKETDYEAIYLGKYDMSQNPITTSLSQNGFTLATTEGSIFPVVDQKALSDFFRNMVSPAMKEYIQLDLAEFQQPAMDDAGIIIPLEEYANRSVAWEKFNSANPHFLLGSYTREHGHWMSLTLLSGVDNTPVADYETEKVSEDFEKVWEYILQKYPETQLAGHIRNLQQIIQKAGGLYNSEARAYVDHLWEMEV